MTESLAQSPFRTGRLSHTGLHRTANEDSLLARPEHGLWAVADGMGGHDYGAFASAAVVHALDCVQAAADLDSLVRRCLAGLAEANHEIRSYAAARGAPVVGTTVAVLMAAGGRYACLWCGDSRIYRLRREAIEQLSHDHTEVQDMVDRGLVTPEQAKTWPNRNALTRAIGVVDEPQVDIARGALVANDIFVLCSDGLTTHVADEEILSLAARRSAASGCEALVDLALERGGRDNVTVIVVQYAPDGTRRAPGHLPVAQG